MKIPLIIRKIFEKSSENKSDFDNGNNKPVAKGDMFSNGGLIANGPGFVLSFDGEKNLGEMGPVVSFNLDHGALSARGWQLFLESETCQMVFRNYAKWVVGSGLKLQAEPQKSVLETEGVTVDSEIFSKAAEGRWKIFANSKLGDAANMRSLNYLQHKAFLSAKVGGDVLVILRLVGKYPNAQIKVQLVDGAHIQSPFNYSFNVEGFMTNPDNGNRIKNGVELDANNNHVAYYIRKGLVGTERITARDSKGVLRAYLVYGLEYRIDSVRGIPLITAVMESAKKLERYKEATIAGAEETSKVAYQIVHKRSSTGENPFDEASALVKGGGSNRGGGMLDDVAITAQGERLADKVTATTNKMAINMPIESELKSIENKAQLYFAEFFEVNINLICATVGIPPDVAMSNYKGSYSSSRAAIKDWEHTLQVERKDFSDQFLQPIYNLWLWVQVLQNKIAAPGYLTAVAQGNDMVLEGYQYSRFTGSNVPHIDPLKEVQAVRAKLGSAGAHLPFITLEEAIEELNGGDTSSTLEQYAKELEKAEALGIEPEELTPEPPEDDEKTPVKKQVKK